MCLRSTCTFLHAQITHVKNVHYQMTHVKILHAHVKKTLHPLLFVAEGMYRKKIGKMEKNDREGGTDLPPLNREFRRTK